MTRRAHISLNTKLASTLFARGDVPYDDAKKMTADQIVSLYEFHHNIRHAEEGSIHFANLEPMLRAAHRKRTAEVDIPQIAKNRDIRDKALLLDAALARKSGDDLAADMLLEQVRPSRRRPKATIRSAGFNKRMTKGFDGKVRERSRKQRRGL